MVHYVDVHLPWSHSLCACCLPRMLRPAPPITFQISSLTSLRKHLQQPVPPAMLPFRLPNKPTPPILAYSATIPLSAPPLRPPGNSGAAAAAAAPAASAGPGLASAPSLADQYRWKVDAAPVVAAEGMMLEWLAEPRVGLLLDLQIIRRQLAYILGIDSLAAARAAAGTRSTGGEAASRQELWWCCWQCSRCWTRYRRAVSIPAFTVLVAKFPRFVTLWRANIRSATVAFPNPLFAQSAALVFSDSAGSRFKERVEDAAVEEARNLLAAGEKGTEGSGVQDRGKRAVDSDVPRVAPASSAAGATGATKASSSASGARLVPVNSNAVVGLFTYRVTCLLRWVRLYGFRVNSSEHCICSDRKKPAIALLHPIHDLPNLLQRFGAAPKPQAATGLEGSPATVWKEFPEGDRAAVAEGEKDTGEFMGIKILHVGAFQGGEVDREEVKKEHNVRELNLPPLGTLSTVNHNPGGGYTLQDNTSGPYFPTLSHRVEEFLRRFAPARLAREGRNGPLARAITSWAGRLGLRDRAWAALALGPFAPGRIKPILRSRIQVDILIEMIANSILPAPVCTRCDCCIGTYYLAVNLTSLVVTFACRPSSALLRCILSLFPARSARFRSFLENLGVAPLPAVVPDSLVAALLEGVMEEHHLPLIFYGTQLILKEEGFEAILEPVGQDGGGQARGEGQQQQQQGEEEWRMWEEVESWRMAAGNAWPALEAHGAALQRGAGRGVGGVEEEELEECCEGMRRAMRDDVAVAAARKEALIAMVIAAGDPGATGANAGTRTGEGQGGRAGASYLEPWPGGGNPSFFSGLVTASWYAPSEALTLSTGPTPVNVDLAASSDLSDSSVASTLSSSGDSAAAVAKSAKLVPAAVQAPPAPRAAATPIAPRACPRPLVLSAYDGVLDPDLFDAAGELGRGGFGTVVAMRRVESGEVVAVKRAERKQLVAASNEAMVSASLSECPGVLGVREVHLAEQHAYMLSDVCHGGDLRALLQRRKAATSNTTGDAGRSDWRRWWRKASGEGGRGGGMAEAEALEVVKHVGDAVAFVTSEACLSAPVSSARTSPRMAAGAVRLADFGLAQVVAEGQRGCSIPAGTPGKPAGGAEVRSAEAAGYGRAADVWSLGMTLYEMIAGERPYSGEAPQQGGWRAPVDGAAWVGVSEECRALVSGMLRRGEQRGEEQEWEVVVSAMGGGEGGGG
ncbi:unnamed protein product [Closterium sp. NIES-65]|nr:unnamed protein product [Closterium sp. NIES-65]